MKLEDIFTAEELALIDSGEYRPGRGMLDAKLDLWAAIEREACAKLLDEMYVYPIQAGIQRATLEDAATSIRARGQA